MALEPVSRFIQQRFNMNPYQRLEWATNEALQLQRMAHEELGAGIWTGAAETIPLTEKDDKLATLDISEERHPRLMYQRPYEDKGKSTTHTLDHESSSSETNAENTSQVPNNESTSSVNFDGPNCSNDISGITSSNSNETRLPSLLDAPASQRLDRPFTPPLIDLYIAPEDLPTADQHNSDSPRRIDDGEDSSARHFSALETSREP
ncbi:MAG: hypothetical protein Q9160_009298 [Pyrenula sp. 1 TL-2023]